MLISFSESQPGPLSEPKEDTDMKKFNCIPAILAALVVIIAWGHPGFAGSQAGGGSVLVHTSEKATPASDPPTSVPKGSTTEAYGMYADFVIEVIDPGKVYAIRKNGDAQDPYMQLKKGLEALIEDRQVEIVSITPITQLNIGAQSGISFGSNTSSLIVLTKPKEREVTSQDSREPTANAKK